LSRHETVGRLGQVCDRWIYSACACFGLDLDEQERSGFRYSYSISQVEYSRNLLFEVGGDMDRVFNAVVDRTAVASTCRRSVPSSASSNVPSSAGAMSRRLGKAS
jgi:hypothetical protein